MARDDDFVARPHALQLMEQIDDQGRRGAEHAMGGAGVGGQLGLEGLGLFAQDVLSGAQRAQSGLFHLGSEGAFRRGIFAVNFQRPAGPALAGGSSAGLQAFNSTVFPDCTDSLAASRTRTES